MDEAHPILAGQSGRGQRLISERSKRRHMTPGQQAAIVASAQNWGRAQGDGKPGNLARLDTRADRAAQSGASDKTQRDADMVDRLRKELDAPAEKVPTVGTPPAKPNNGAGVVSELPKKEAVQEPETEATTLLNVSPRSVATASNLGRAMYGGAVIRLAAL